MGQALSSQTNSRTQARQPQSNPTLTGSATRQRLRLSLHANTQSSSGHDQSTLSSRRRSFINWPSRSPNSNLVDPSRRQRAWRRYSSWINPSSRRQTADLTSSESSLSIAATTHTQQSSPPNTESEPAPPPSPIPRRAHVPRPSNALVDRLQSHLNPARLSRTVSNPLRRRRQHPFRSEDQLPILSELLSVAAAATAASLMGNDPNAVRNARGIGGDESLESFLESLQNGRMVSALNRNASEMDADGNPTGTQGINFVRLFRFGSSEANNRTNQDSSSEAPNSTGGRMVPIIIVGIRSITPSATGSSTVEDQTMQSFIDSLTSLPDPMTSASNGAEHDSNNRSDMDSPLHSIPVPSARFSHRRRTSLGGFGNHRLTPPLDSPPSRPFSSAATSEAEFPLRPPPSTPAFSSGATTPTTSGPSSSQISPAGPSRRSSSVGPGVESSSGGLSPSANNMPIRPISMVDDNVANLSAHSTPINRFRAPRRRGRRPSESEIGRFGAGAARRNGIVEPDSNQAVGDEADIGEDRELASGTNGTGSGSNSTGAARSWIIYVLGGSYPENHPLLNTPSLFTDSPTYEDMVLLSSLLGQAKPPVASEADVRSAPGLFRIRVGESPGTVVGVLEPSNDGTIDETEEILITIGLDERCLVCLSDFEPDEECRKLMGCGHLFHRECIDHWLTTGRNSCPLCRQEGIKKTSQTPSTTSNAPSIVEAEASVEEPLSSPVHQH